MGSDAIEAPLVYTGPERRLSCICHPKHTRILADHDAKLKQHEENLSSVIDEIKRRREELDRRTDGKFTEIWGAIRSKLSARVFLALVLAFGGTFFATIFFIYRDSQAIRLDIMKAITEVKAELHVVSTDVKIGNVRIGNIERGISKLETDYEEHLEKMERQ